MIKIKIIPYGIFRDYIEEDTIIELKKEDKIKHLKEYLINNIFTNELKFLEKILNKSVLASDNKILDDDHKINNGDIINLLPPFSGG